MSRRSTGTKRLNGQSHRKQENTWTEREGSPSPLGVTWIEQEEAYNFTLYSENATGVKLLLYSERDVVTPVYLYQMDYLKDKTGHVWHCRISIEKTPEARYYAYQVEGPFDPAAGYRFDPHKILLDPYARAVFLPRHCFCHFSSPDYNRPTPHICRKNDSIALLFSSRSVSV